jgi:hypothetical protein
MADEQPWKARVPITIPPFNLSRRRRCKRYTPARRLDTYYDLLVDARYRLGYRNRVCFCVATVEVRLQFQKLSRSSTGLSEAQQFQ